MGKLNVKCQHCGSKGFLYSDELLRNNISTEDILRYNFNYKCGCCGNITRAIPYKTFMQELDKAMTDALANSPKVRSGEFANSVGKLVGSLFKLLK